MIRQSLLGLSLCMSIPSFALIEHEMDESIPFKVSFSSEYNNRIKVDGGAIHEIRFPEEAVFISKDHLTGQAFVQLSNPEYMGHPIQITLISALGSIQDLLLEFREQEREFLILKEKLSEEEENPSKEKEILNILQAALREEAPQGFIERGFHEEEKATSSYRKGVIVASPLKIFEAPGESVEIWELRNTSEKKAFISEKDFVSTEISWLHMDEMILLPGDKTRLVVAKRGRV